ncbi:MAG: VWA domain-containing protein [Gammaproteobacteria bacterium]
MNWSDFHFIRPFWLLALIPYLAVLLLMLRNALGRGNWSAVCDAALLPYLLDEKTVRQTRWPVALGAIAALFSIIAMAGPSWQRLPSPVFRSDSALVIALDLSSSMDAEDIKPSRLIRARYKIADMLKQRKDGQTALLVYAGDAFTVTPLTDDTETIASQLEALTTDIMPSPGSDTAAVLNKAADLLKQAGMQRGRIVLVTDGANPDQTLDSLKALDDFDLSILGVGTPEGAPIPLPKGGFMKDRKGSIVIPKLNGNELRQLAAVGGGIYRTLSADDSDIKDLLANAGRPEQRLQEKEGNQLVLDLWEDKGPWFLLPVLLFAALLFRKGLLTAALVFLLPWPKTGHAVEWRELWLTQDQRAERAYRQVHYQQAGELFENPDWQAAAQYKTGRPVSREMKTPKTATGFYNQGNVLAKSGQFEKAIESYDAVLKSALDSRLIEDAEFNKKLVEQALEKRDQQKQQQDSRQKDEQQQKPGDDARQNKGGDTEQNRGGENERSQEPEKPSSESERPTDEQESTVNPRKNNAEEKSVDDQKERETPSDNHDDKRPEINNAQDTTKASPTNEQLQANEQWLNRIPDDPAGLLKRKFKYQYGRRGKRQQQETEW